MAIPSITLLPTAPQSTDPTNFRTDADLFVAALNVFDGEMNNTIAGINAVLPSLDVASAAVNFQGTWSSATAYTIGQSVVYSGVSYAAILAGTNKQPDTNPTYWMPTGVAQLTHNATAKTTPIDADEFALIDSAASNVLKKVTWANIKATLSSLFAPLASPVFTGTPSLPTGTTAVTQSAGDNSTKLATTAFTKSKSEGDSIGVNQTWQTPTRVVNTVYQNTTGKPIQVYVNIATSTTDNNIMQISSDNITWISVGARSSSALATSYFIVPNNNYYKFNTTGTITTWSELR